MDTSLLGATVLVLSMLIYPGVLLAQTPDPAQNIRDAEAAKSNLVYAADAPRLENEARLLQLIRTMNREMAMLRGADDQPERARLMDMHSRHLHETMMLLRVTGGGDMGRVVAEHNVAVSEEPSLHVEASLNDGSASAEDRIVILEKRLDMMQMVMESVLDHLTMIGTRH